MNKLKINSGLLSIVLVGCLFLGWQSMVFVSILTLIFCEIDEKTKQIFVKILSFFIAITLFSLLWSLIVDGIDLGISSIKDLVGVINSYLEYDQIIELTKLDKYVFIPVKGIVSIADSVIGYLITFVKFSFIVTLFLNKGEKPKYFIKKIEEYVLNIIKFVNSFEMNTNVNQTPQASPNYNQPTMQTYNQMPPQNFNQNM